MRFSDIFDSYISDGFRSDAEVRKVVEQFKNYIPARVLHMEFDASTSNKQGVKDGDKVYKLGLDLAAHTVFIEYLEHYGQEQPTMAIYVDRAKNRITVNGRQVNKTLYVRYYIENGAVGKSVKLD